MRRHARLSDYTHMRSSCAPGTKLDNAFTWIEDMDRAQRFANHFQGLGWPTILDKYVNELFRNWETYWMAAATTGSPPSWPGRAWLRKKKLPG
jgi:hypothetical protein